MSNKKDKKKVDKEEFKIKSYGKEYYEDFQKGFATVSEPKYSKPPVKKPQKKLKEEAEDQ